MIISFEIRLSRCISSKVTLKGLIRITQRVKGSILVLNSAVLTSPVRKWILKLFIPFTFISYLGPRVSEHFLFQKIYFRIEKKASIYFYGFVTGTFCHQAKRSFDPCLSCNTHFCWSILRKLLKPGTFYYALLVVF